VKPTLKQLSLQISGLEALHDMRIIHCDLKPDNILVYPDGHLSISDFGLAVSWLDPRYNDYPSHAFRGRGLGGTYGYMAPEIISAFQNPDGPRRGNYGFAADIWSMGVIVAELGMRGRHFVSYEDEEERERWKGDFESFACDVVLSREMLMKRIEKHLWGDHAMLVERVRVILKLTLSGGGTNRSFTKMIEIDEASRPSFDEIFSHPFFSDLDLGKVSQRDYQGKGPFDPDQEILTDTTSPQFQLLHLKGSYHVGTHMQLNIGSQSTPR
jgi:serine/threonine protein kinase